MAGPEHADLPPAPRAFGLGVSCRNDPSARDTRSAHAAHSPPSDRGRSLAATAAAPWPRSIADRTGVQQEISTTGSLLARTVPAPAPAPAHACMYKHVHVGIPTCTCSALPNLSAGRRIRGRARPCRAEADRPKPVVSRGYFPRVYIKAEKHIGRAINVCRRWE